MEPTPKGRNDNEAAAGVSGTSRPQWSRPRRVGMTGLVPETHRMGGAASMEPTPKGRNDVTDATPAPLPVAGLNGADPEGSE